MNTSSKISGLLLVTCSLLLARLVFAQGDLTPPGPPAPTMKTLDQIEPRTDLATVAGSSTADHVISAPGSYYLSRNLNMTKDNGIEIRSSGVTLDLMGFRITRSTAGSSDAIEIALGGLTDITIKNGNISGPNLADGIAQNTSPDPTNVRVTRLNVSGCSSRGINLGRDESASVDHSSVHTTGSIGIEAGEVSHSTAIACGGTAILVSGNVFNSRAESSGGDGILASGNVANSFGSATGAGDNGIGTLFGNVTNSSGLTTGAGGNGIVAGGNVTGSRGQSSGDNGILAENTISYSHGGSTGTGVGLACAIAVGCTSSGGESITNKYLMP